VIGTQSGGNFLVPDTFAVLANGGNAATGNGGGGNTISIQAASITLGAPAFRALAVMQPWRFWPAAAAMLGAISIGATAGDLKFGATARTEYTGTGQAIANGTGTAIGLEYFVFTARGATPPAPTGSVSGGAGSSVRLDSSLRLD